MTKIRKRNKSLNDALLSRSCGRHEPKHGKKKSRAKEKHSKLKEQND